MSLSALIHKSKVTVVATETVAALATAEGVVPCHVATVATVSVATAPEQQSGTLVVVCYSPAGDALRVVARDAEHADFLLRMNPNRSNYEQ